jgi:DNA (cytosine-5)-methyltransferase 3A
MLKDILESAYTERDKSRVIASSIGRTTPREYFKKRQGQMVYTKPIRIGAIGNPGQANRVYSPEGKSVCLQANCGGTGAKTGLYMIQTPRGNNNGGIKALDGKTPTISASSWEENNKLYKDGLIRKLTPIECERLQGLPDNYTEGVSNTQRYKMLGNAFNVDVVAHILKHIV